MVNPPSASTPPWRGSDLRGCLKCPVNDEPEEGWNSEGLRTFSATKNMCLVRRVEHRCKEGHYKKVPVLSLMHATKFGV